MSKEEPFVHIDVGLLAHDVGEATANTLDGGERKHNLLLTIDIRVENTKNMLEILVCDQRLRMKSKGAKRRR